MTGRALTERLIPILLLAGCLLLPTTAMAASFTVHGYELGERIELLDERRVWTAELDVTLDGHDGTSFCVDLMTHIGVGTYQTRAVLDPVGSVSPSDELPRDFAWAGYVMDTFAHDLSLLTVAGISRTQAITGVQAAIWEGIYQGGVIDRSSLSNGARSVFDQIMASDFANAAPGSSLIVELAGRQDQVFSNPVPEPTAALVFGVGLMVFGRAVRRSEPR